MVGRLFRPIDWIAFGIVLLCVLSGYLLTIAPDLTLEDSGELAVASMYAGVPHPPGYPIWTLYTWLFTKLLPFSNIAWRVAVSSAFAAAMSAAMVAMLVSRASTLFLDSVDLFKDRDQTLDRWIALATGFVSGMLLGYNGYIWSQAVIVEVYTIAVWSLMGVLMSLNHYMYLPHQRRYLYLGCFLFGLCFCNHQTLIVGAMGLEVIVLMADRRVGRDFLLLNSAIWMLGLAGHASGSIGTFRDNPALLTIFNLVGVASLVGCIWTSVLTGEIATRLHAVVAAGLSFGAGALGYAYMPIASSSNPPLNWGYPRTWEGFIHAFTRGQYEKTTPGISWGQISAYLDGMTDEFNFAVLLLAIVPFFFFARLRARERGWLIGLTATYFCLAALLIYLLNAGTDKQSRELVKVFYTSSHVMIAMSIGYGLTLLAGLVQKPYHTWRTFLIGGAVIAVALTLWALRSELDDSQNRFLIPRIAKTISLAVAVGVLVCFMLWKSEVVQVFVAKPGLPGGPEGTPEDDRGPRRRLACILSLVVLLPADSILDHWADNEQRNHYFGFWFGHDMFEPGTDTSAAPAPKDKDGKPLYPPMDKHTVLFGGTDPGRFCPTYMIFCESFIPPQHRRNPNFDRRDVYLITQNALADNTYLDYIRAHYNRSAQVDVPFFQSWWNDPVSISRDRTNSIASALRPLDRLITSVGNAIEKDRRAGSSFFKPSDFKDLAALKTRINAAADPVSAFLKEKLGAAASGDGETLADGLNALLEGPSLHTPERFAQVKLSDHVQKFAKQNPPTHNRIRLNRLLLEEAYAGLIAASPAGLYPDREILTPTPEDLKRCFEEYSIDAQRRAQLRQLRPGEIMTTLPDGRVSVSGQTAVMSINGLLTKVIFDKNPDHSFYVEESFALDWMYPHLVPFGIILKIEREPVAMLSDDQIRRDHEYWSQYSERFIGNWITYDTPVKEVCDFALRTYLLRDYTGFKGDARFVRDDNAQKAFSKLRNAIGKSVYGWRAQEARDPVYQAKLIKEAEFAMKQAFAFCPYSSETVFNYASLLAGLGRYPEAYQVVETCYQLDTDNRGIAELLSQLAPYKDKVMPSAALGAAPPSPANITNLESAFELASTYLSAGRSNDAVAILDALLAKPDADLRTLASLAQAYQQLQRIDRIETTLERYARLQPDSPEGWYQLAAVQAVQGKSSSTASSLRKAFELSDRRLATNPAAANLRTQLTADPRFEFVRPSLDPKL